MREDEAQGTKTGGKLNSAVGSVGLLVLPSGLAGSKSCGTRENPDETPSSVHHQWLPLSHLPGLLCSWEDGDVSAFKTQR